MTVLGLTDIGSSIVGGVGLRGGGSGVAILGLTGIGSSIEGGAANLTGGLISASSFLGIEGVGVFGIFSTSRFLILSSGGCSSVIALRFCTDVLLNFWKRSAICWATSPEIDANSLVSPALIQSLHILLIKMQSSQRREAQGELAKRVGRMFQGMNRKNSPLYPIEIEIDNESSKLYTVLQISSIDTVGFLYEFSNALALNHINITRMFVQSIDRRINDTFYVTDDEGNKIIAPDKQRELRAATVLIKHFTHLLPLSPNPETALLHFREFLGQLFERPNWPDELVKLERPEVLDALARLLGVSDFLWDDFLRMQYSNLFPIVRDIDALAVAHDQEQLQKTLNALLKQREDWRVVLNAFKDREMFRIDMRHIMGYTQEFWNFSADLEWTSFFQ